MDLKTRIKEGIDGQYSGLENGFERLNDVIFGMQRRCYTLLGGQSGTYKTTLVDYILFNAMEDAKKKGIKLNVFYYSFEIDRITKQCNWLSQIIFKRYNVIVPPEKIKGLGGNKLGIDEVHYLYESVDYVEELFSQINFRFQTTNPTGIYNELWAFGASQGEFIKEPYSYVNAEGVKVNGQRIAGYKPNDPHAYTIVIMDHMALMKKERGFQTKELIDKYSEYCIELKNMFGFSFINIQQFNQGLSSVDRAKFKGIDLSPQQSDFKDSTNPYQDADVVLGTMCPYKLDMNSCLGYDIKKLKDKMIMLKVIKNRLSKDNVAIGLYANPSAGAFAELPPVNSINYDDYV
jgi:hypothetical protein